MTDPWTYMVAVVNGRPARSQYVYLLLNLWERSLRYRIDAEYSRSRGADWFRLPAAYLDRMSLGVWVEKLPKLIFPGHRPQGGYEVARRFQNGVAFLEELYLPELHDILRLGWAHTFMINMPHPAAGAVQATDLILKLNDAHSARTIVMHAKDFDNALFRQSTDAVRFLLELLGYNVDKALNHIADRDPHEEDLKLFTSPRPSIGASASPASPAS